jgi:hypothetical protein
MRPGSWPFMRGASLRSRKRTRDIDGPDTEAPPASAAGTCIDVYALAEGELMHSTSRASAGKRAWLRMLCCLERQPGYAYVSCDGSSSGWHACVVAAGEQLHLRARWADMQVCRQLSRCISLVPVPTRISRSLLGHAERWCRGERLRSGRHHPAAGAGRLQPRSCAERLSQRFGIRL